MQILIGILVLVGLLGIATLFHLTLLGTILRLLLVGAAVTIPIVFQPELRRALEQIGRGGLFRLQSGDDAELRPGRPEDRAMVMLARTAFFLSSEPPRCADRHRAAERPQRDLRERHAPCTPTSRRSCCSRSSRRPHRFTMEPSSFTKEAIEAAGCLLPLAERPLTGERMGTRHRAARRTERADRRRRAGRLRNRLGAIRIARAGRLSRPVDDEQRLVKMLLAVTRPPRHERRASQRSHHASALSFANAA